ncbi:MAG TPA: UPF0262 family protein [Polyangiaceae bacterium]
MIRAVRIDDALWDAASKLRRHDWQLSIADLTDDARLGDEDDHLLHVAHTRQALVLSTFDEQGAPRAAYELPNAELRKHVDEYLAIIQKMHGDETNDASARMHALDMAKKVVHDAGARTLARAAAGLARDHESYRRLFSLLLAVVIDVTKLPGAIGHRRHV